MEERIYTINLRRSVLFSPNWRKSDDAVAVVRNFLKRHMKSDDIKIDPSISKNVWQHGNQRPPSKIRIKAIKDDEGKVTASLFGVVTPEELKVEETKEKKEVKTEEKK